MKKLGSIYVSDIRNIATNWTAAVVILGLILLPSLYAWFNIAASWDPYSSTQGIQIAVTNLDKGAQVQDKPINLGLEIKKSLEANPKIGWVFVSHEAAQTGLKQGNYYAAIEIPEEFSQRIASVLTPDPVKAEIRYTVNEKINAVAPKITSKGASSITQEINRNFVKTANGAIFKIFNELGIELEQQLPLINTMKGVLYKLETLFPEINRAADLAVKDLQESNKIIKAVQSRVPAAAELARKGTEFSSGLIHFLDQSSSALSSAAPHVKLTLLQIRQALERAELGIAAAAAETENQTNDKAPEALNSILVEAQERAAEALAGARSFESLIDSMNAVAPSASLTAISDQIKDVIARSEALQSSLLQAPKPGSEPNRALLDNSRNIVKSVSSKLDQMIASYDQAILPELQTALSQAKSTAARTRSTLLEAQRSLPRVEQILTDASLGLTQGLKEAEHVRNRLPEAEAKLRSVGDRLHALEQEGHLEDLIKLLQLNYQKESEFFAEPVVLAENKIFPIPNYGSAMSPFFTTLSLWVGGLLLVSMLTTEVHSKGEYSSYQMYCGRFLTFGTLALLQAFFVATGDLLVLGTYAKEKLLFILFSLLISLVFMLMIYTLVSVFGNVGKALAIVLLVLQLAGSGGTFPIQVTPPFFQLIYPFLPFTYGIGLLREAVGGIVPELVTRDILILTLYGLLALLLGLTLKSGINRLAAPLVQKARKSGLIH
ncbi:YhgE/Pip domain-containing protein [Paenibacillus sp. YPG26]|uniref:YhgE/Pip domain-containing protein n=1 Tax=Paenibacillus sp. YPG26 TaxID=2878915 RepID=UPI00203C0871|nr:YhgE/Pip domain-containing protein [Paenibacillus sp. YPG26]USB31977.1 YhgE/Pip domain-containing protein [Paenibacillus sp. YPG26]